MCAAAPPPFRPRQVEGWKIGVSAVVGLLFITLLMATLAQNYLLWKRMKSNEHLQVTVFSCFSCHFQSFMPPSGEHAVLSSGCGVLHVLLCCNQSPCCHISMAASPRLLLHLLHAEMSPSKYLQLLCMLSANRCITCSERAGCAHLLQCTSALSC